MLSIRNEMNRDDLVVHKQQKAIQVVMKFVCCEVLMQQRYHLVHAFEMHINVPYVYLVYEYN